MTYTQQTTLLIFVSAMASMFLAGCRNGENNDRTWSVYKADANSSNYSPLDQINVENVNQLTHAWTFTMQDSKGAIPRPSQCNPIIVDGVLYAHPPANGRMLLMRQPENKSGHSILLMVTRVVR